jgi:hypothetical protein
VASCDSLQRLAALVTQQLAIGVSVGQRDSLVSDATQVSCFSASANKLINVSKLGGSVMNMGRMVA